MNAHPMPAPATAPATHWQRTRRLTMGLLLLWGLLVFVPVYFARELSWTLMGWPLSFWLASQGCLLGFVTIVHVYARRMERLDAEARLSEESR